MSNTLDNNRPDQDSLRIEIVVDENLESLVDENSLQRAAIQAARQRGYNRGEIGIRVTDDEIIQQINRQHLGHDYSTDVISFAYHAEVPFVEGELVVSAETARERAIDLGWPAAHELVLYVVHGTLHITGMDDRRANDRAQMREAEQRVMMQIGIDDIVRFGVDQKGPSVVEGQG